MTPLAVAGCRGERHGSALLVADLVIRRPQFQRDLNSASVLQSNNLAPCPQRRNHGGVWSANRSAAICRRDTSFSRGDELVASARRARMRMTAGLVFKASSNLISR